MNKALLPCVVILMLTSIAAAVQELSVNCVHRGARILVPVRGIFETMGASVEWFADTRAVHITSGNTVIVICVDETEASVNDQLVTMDVPARIWDERLVVPVRFVAEALGRVVNYQGDRIVLGSATGEELVLLIASRRVIPAAPPSAGGGQFATGCVTCGR